MRDGEEKWGPRVINTSSKSRERKYPPSYKGLGRDVDKDLKRGQNIDLSRKKTI